LGECPFCGNGVVRVGKRADGGLFAICDGCEAEWVDVALAPKVEGLHPDVTAHDVWPPLWPTKEDIAKAGLANRKRSAGRTLTGDVAGVLAISD